MCSGLDQSANTTDAGALKVRTISNSSSATLLATVMTLSLFELPNVGGHPVEALLPEAPINREPIVHGLQPSHLEPAWPPLGLPPPGYQPGSLQHLQMARHSRQADSERLGDFVDGRFALH